MPTDPQHGEIWIVDFGMTAKQRPVLVLAYPQPEDARALAIVAPLTGEIRGFRGEVSIGKPRWLSKPSAVNIQGLTGIDYHALKRKLGTLPTAQLEEVKNALRDLLGL